MIAKRVAALFLFILVYLSVSCQKKTFWQPQNVGLIENNRVNVDKSFKLIEFEKNMSIETLVINFFAPDCKGCVDEIPVLEKIEQLTHKDSSIAFVTIGSLLGSVSDEENQKFDEQTAIDKILLFADQFKMKTPLYLANPQQLQSYGVTGFPETFILKRDEKKKFVIVRHVLGVLQENIAKSFLPQLP